MYQTALVSYLREYRWNTPKSFLDVPWFTVEPLWATLGHDGPGWTVLDSDWLGMNMLVHWVILNRDGPRFINLNHIGKLWTVMDHYECDSPRWTMINHYGPCCTMMGQNEPWSAIIHPYRQRWTVMDLDWPCLSIASYWTMMDHDGTRIVILDNIGPLWVVMDHDRSLLTIMHNNGSK